MRLTRFGERYEAPAFFDMACRCKPPKARWYGKGFRIGDRAAAYIYMLDWRKRNPTRKLSVLEDVFLPGAACALDAENICAEMADEVWYAEAANEPVPRPPGEPLYNRSLWLMWKELRVRHKDLPKPGFKPNVEVSGIVDRSLDTYHVPPFYASVQPLCDAQYNGYRNAPVAWWQSVCGSLSERGIPVVVVDRPLSPFVAANNPKCENLLISISDISNQLAIINRASVHIGGETGLTLWAAIMGVPVVAAYKFWGIMNHMDARPIPFGAPVVHSDLRGSPDAVARKAAQLLSFKVART